MVSARTEFPVTTMYAAAVSPLAKTFKPRISTPIELFQPSNHRKKLPGPQAARTREAGQAAISHRRQVTAAEMRDVALHRHDFHGDWNHQIHPRAT
jgi:hypothetical protein